MSEQVRSCRYCGCTDADCSGCIAQTGKPCSWIDKDVCSACVESHLPGLVNGLFLFKQWGEWAPTDMLEGDCNDPNAVMKHIGKKAAGRPLDGRMHHQFPDPPDHHIPALTSAQIAKPGACGQDGRPSAHPHQIRTNP